MTERLCPRCHRVVEPIYNRGKHATWHNDTLYECPACCTAWPSRELTPAGSQVPYCERAERRAE